MKTLIFLTLLSVAISQEFFKNTARYDGYKIISATPHTKEQADILLKLATDPQVDFQSFTLQLGTPSEILVPPRYELIPYLTKYGLDVEVKVDDYQKQIETEEERLMRRYNRDEGTFIFDINDFNTYDDIMAELEVWVGDCPAGYACNTRSVGTSSEGWDIKAFVIKPDDGTDHPIYWVDSLIHAREWLSGATLLKIMHHMVYNAGDPDVSRLLSDNEWVFVPVMNPDGYSWTWTDDRNWRKSRNVNSGSTCMGTDLNRNYVFMWGNDGSSSDPCSTSYMGSAAGSESETQDMMAEWEALGPRMVALVSMHTQGQMWLTAWGHTEGLVCAYPPDYDELMVVCNAMADATQDTWGTTWTRGSICSTIYAASGSSIDHAKATYGVKYVFAPELRGMGTPANASIEPSFTEIWNAMVAMDDTIPPN